MTTKPMRNNQPKPKRKKQRAKLNLAVLRPLKPLLIVMLVVAVLLGGVIGVNTWRGSHVKVVRESFHAETLPSSFYGYRILCISDFINSGHSAQIAKIVNEENPDIVLLLGNMLRHPQGTDHLVQLMSQIGDGIPVYGVLGSQEMLAENQWQLVNDLQSIGIQCLSNRKITLTRDKDTVDLIGVNEVMDDQLGDSSKMAQARQFLEKEINPNRFTLVATRRATMYPYLSDLPAALLLSAYNKECELRMSAEGYLMPANEGFFPDYEAGYYGEGSMVMYVIGGCNPKPAKLLLFKQPSVTVVTLKR